jgi:hypothetical protein
VGLHGARFIVESKPDLPGFARHAAAHGCHLMSNGISPAAGGDVFYLAGAPMLAVRFETWSVEGARVEGEITIASFHPMPSELAKRLGVLYALREGLDAAGERGSADLLGAHLELLEQLDGIDGPASPPEGYLLSFLGVFDPGLPDAWRLALDEAFGSKAMDIVHYTQWRPRT